ncbi:hypothetical protein ACN47A_31140 [Myxococcus fulvus]|uniref:hypothetical protein n=1 Tax=Myxococcus fulvus TaxID=33 RepID=UPI003B9A373D
MAKSRGLGSWWYRLGLGGDCQGCGARLREVPTKTLRGRLCRSCVREYYRDATLVDQGLHLAVELGVRGLGFIAVGWLLAAVVKWTLVLLALGGVGWLLHLGMKHAHLPAPLAVGLGILVLLAAFFLLRPSSTPRR